MKHPNSKIAALALSLALSACNVSGIAPEEYARREPPSPESMARAFVVCDHLASGGWIKPVNVLVDGAAVGKLGLGTFLFVDLPPGQHTVGIKGGPFLHLQVVLTAVAGESVYLKYHPAETAIDNEFRLEIVPATAGETSKKVCEYVGDPALLGKG